MARFIALDVIAFLLPFLVYWGWLILSRSPKRHPKHWEGSTLVVLSIIGSLIILATIVAFIHLGGTGSQYHPAEFRDGKIVPGGFD